MKKILLFLMFILFFLSLFSDFTFVVIGDNRNSFGTYEFPRAYKVLLEQIKLIGPDFVINTGDIIMGYGDDKERWLKEASEFKKISKILGNIPYYITPGNHEMGCKWGYELFKENFNKTYFYFIKDNALFIILNTDEGIYRKGDVQKLGKKQLDWLESILKKYEDVDLKFLFTHRPVIVSPDALPATATHYNPSSPTEIKNISEYNRLLSLCKTYGVKYIFSGHEHLYARCERDGIVQYITGGAGAETSVRPEEGAFYHFLLVRVSGKNVKIDTVKALSLYSKKVSDHIYKLYCFSGYLLPLEIRGLPLPPLKLHQFYSDNVVFEKNKYFPIIYHTGMSIVKKWNLQDLKKSKLVEINLPFNADGIENEKDNSSTNLDGTYYFPASIKNYLRKEITDLFDFKLNSEGNDCSSLKGQKIKIEKGHYSKLYVFATATWGRKFSYFGLKRSDGTIDRYPLKISDWCEKPTYGELIAAKSPFRLSSKGKELINCYIFLQEINLDSKYKYDEIIFPHELRLYIFKCYLKKGE